MTLQERRRQVAQKSAATRKRNREARAKENEKAQPTLFETDKSEAVLEVRICNRDDMSTKALLNIAGWFVSRVGGIQKAKFLLNVLDQVQTEFSAFGDKNKQ